VTCAARASTQRKQPGQDGVRRAGVEELAEQRGRVTEALEAFQRNDAFTSGRKGSLADRTSSNLKDALRARHALVGGGAGLVQADLAHGEAYIVLQGRCLIGR